MNGQDIRAMHRAALSDAGRLVERIEDAQMGLRTPCAGWDLRQLLDHMVGQHIGFARAVGDGDAPPAAYLPVPFTQASWTESVDTMTSVFADVPDLTRTVLEVELDPVRPLPIAFIVAAQWLDTVVHTWDVAAALGEPYAPPPDVADALWAMAETIPDSERRTLPGSAFAPALPLEGSSWERSLARLGRDPLWS